MTIITQTSMKPAKLHKTTEIPRMVCSHLEKEGHAQGFALLKVLRQLFRVRLIKYFRYTKCRCPENDNAHQLLLIDAVLLCLSSGVLVVLCSVALYFYLFMSCPSMLQPLFAWKEADELLWPACSLKLVLCSPYRNQQRQQRQTRSGQEPKTITVVILLPALHAFFYHLQDCLL